MSDVINQIYDLILKSVLDLSPSAVVGLMNGLFDESFPTDSEVIRTATETVAVTKSGTKKSESDKMLTIKTGEISRRFHIDAEISSNNKEMVIRVFDYGYRDALLYKTTEDGNIVLKFPQPKLIYLEHWSTAPDTVTLELDFWGQSKAKFTVPTMKFLDYSVEELDKRSMVILLPLYLLKLRRKIVAAKEKGSEALKQYVPELKALLNNDILGTIESNVNSGNITHRDAHTMVDLIELLYNHLYGDVQEFQDGGVKGMLEDKLVLASDFKVLEATEKIAKNFLDKGISPEDVADATKLPIEKVRKLHQQEAYAV